MGFTIEISLAMAWWIGTGLLISRIRGAPWVNRLGLAGCTYCAWFGALAPHALATYFFAFLVQGIFAADEFRVTRD